MGFKINLSVLLFVLIVSNELIICVEARDLKAKDCRKCSRHNRHHHHHHRAKSSYTVNEEIDSKMDFVNDFRPTSPGHSPGIGHSVHN